MGNSLSENLACLFCMTSFSDVQGSPMHWNVWVSVEGRANDCCHFKSDHLTSLVCSLFFLECFLILHAGPVSGCADRHIRVDMLLHRFRANFCSTPAAHCTHPEFAPHWDPPPEPSLRPLWWLCPHWLEQPPG